MSGTDGQGAIRLVIPARSESLAVIRQVAAGAADAFGLGEEEAADLKVVASEASSNVVRHAFDDGEHTARAFEVAFEDSEGCVVAIVRDRGGGFIPTADGDSLGLGIPIMASISRTLELRSLEGGGVELRAEIPVLRPGRPGGEHRPAGRREAWPDDMAEASINGASARVSVSSGGSLRSVLARLLGLAAAKVGLTTDELADGLMVSDALSGAATWGDSTEVTVIERADHTELRIGPLPPGAGPALIEALEVPGVGSLARAARGVSVEISEGPPEELSLTVTRREAD